MVRACLKNHSSNLHTPIYGLFCLHSVAVARYAALIQAKSPANCDVHLAESIFQTRFSPADVSLYAEIEGKMSIHVHILTLLTYLYTLKFLYDKV